MRIAQVSTLSTPVRETGADSIESMVWLLSRELVAMGHEVSVFACAGSDVPGELVATVPGPYASAGAPGDWQLCEWINLCKAVEQAQRFDVLHCHGYLWGLPLQGLCKAPMVHTLHVTPYEDQAKLWTMYPQARITGLSKYQWSAFPQVRTVATISHAVDERRFTFRATPGEYVCYLGRFIPGKGPLKAIAAAKEAGVPIILAGPPNEYFQTHIAPLVDGDRVQYAGFVSGEQRDALLGGAKALLYPIEAPEPFGLVLVEAMMCGTPVAAVGLGAVSEVVDEGVTGRVVNDAGQLAAALPEVFALDRNRVRQQALRRYAPRRMAEQYLEVYRGAASARR